MHNTQPKSCAHVTFAHIKSQTPLYNFNFKCKILRFIADLFI